MWCFEIFVYGTGLMPASCSRLHVSITCCESPTCVAHLNVNSMYNLILHIEIRPSHVSSLTIMRKLVTAFLWMSSTLCTRESSLVESNTAGWRLWLEQDKSFYFSHIYLPVDLHLPFGFRLLEHLVNFCVSSLLLTSRFCILTDLQNRNLSEVLYIVLI